LRLSRLEGIGQCLHFRFLIYVSNLFVQHNVLFSSINERICVGHKSQSVQEVKHQVKI